MTQREQVWISRDVHLSLILCLSVNMTKVSCVFCEEDLIIREKHHTDQRLSFNTGNPYHVIITQYPYFNVLKAWGLFNSSGDFFFSYTSTYISPAFSQSLRARGQWLCQCWAPDRDLECPGY